MRHSRVLLSIVFSRDRVLISERASQIPGFLPQKIVNLHLKIVAILLTKDIIIIVTVN